MRPFRFRAEAALQLRRRQHEQVLVRQAAAERALTDAGHAVEAAAETVRQADVRVADVIGASPPQLPWHLAWRVRCVTERQRLEGHRHERGVELERLRQEARESYRRVQSLEHLRERALAEWARLARDEERKAMDALAGSQYVRRKDD